MRITQPEIEYLGWSREYWALDSDFSKDRNAYLLKANSKEYCLIHIFSKRDIIIIFDTSRRNNNEVTQVCSSINDIKQLMKSQNIPYENS